MNLNDYLSDFLKEPVAFKKCSSGWHELLRKNDPSSTRYCFALNESMKGKICVLYDRKTQKSTKIDTDDIVIPTELPFTDPSAPVQKQIVDTRVQPLLDSGTIEDANSYLKNHHLDCYVHKDLSVLWRAGQYKPLKKKAILVPYTTFELYPEYVGLQAYGGKGHKNKSFLSLAQKGNYKGSFHPHPALSKEKSKWILGEGFLDCFLASRLVEDSNVLECGGNSKYKDIINQIYQKDKNASIMILGDNDKGQESINIYNNLRLAYPKIRIVFPLEEKDFSDYVRATKDFEGVRKLLNEININDKNVKYKPLGIIGLKMAFYSKITKKVEIISPDNADSIIRTAVKTSGFHNWTRAKKHQICHEIYEECLKVGDFHPNSLYGRGLWTSNNEVFFNTGDRVYKVFDDKIVPIQHIEAINNNFLLIKTDTDQKTLPSTPFKPYLEKVDKLLQDCHWEHSFYGSILLGFIAQSLYAGSIMEMRPHLWIFSDKTTAGKSWLSYWLIHNLMPFAVKSEGDHSSVSGTRQCLKYDSVLLYCDELAEKGTAFAKEAKKTIQVLRSASTSQGFVNLGKQDQEADKQRMRYSALVSVIEGRDLLQPQDVARFIFIFMKNADKKDFYQNLLPRFRGLENGVLNGFTSFALQKYFLYKKFTNYFENELSEYSIGHRIRGLGGVLSAYSALYGNKKRGVELLKKIKKSKDGMLLPFNRSTEKRDYFETFMNKCVYSDKFHTDKKGVTTIFILAQEGKLQNIGIYCRQIKEDWYITVNFSIADSFILKNLPLSLAFSNYVSILKKSPRYKLISMRVKELKYPTRQHCFFVSDWIENRRINEN